MDDYYDNSDYDKFNSSTTKIKILSDYESSKKDYCTEIFISEEEKIIYNKINLLQKKILNYMNVALDLNMIGNETKLDLSFKNIDDSTLNLFSGLKLKNLEELNLSHNNISDIKIIKKLYLKKMRILDLSFNKIYKIKNPVKNSDENIKKKDIKINLDNNNLIQMDIEEIKDFIKNVEYNKNKSESPYEYLSIDEIKKLRVEKLLSKLERLEQKVLSYFNLTGKEISINLRNSNFNDTKLELLSGVEFKNLEELNLSHNQITNLLPLENFKTVKKLNLSFNKINDIEPLKEISEKNKVLKEIDLRNNEIKDVGILKLNIFPLISKISLENNKNLIEKDLKEILNLVKQRKELYNDNKDNFRNNYEIIEEIKRVENEVIYKAKEKKNGELRAIKVLEKTKITKRITERYKYHHHKGKNNSYIEPEFEGWLDEINNMKIIYSNNMKDYLVKIYDYFDTEEELIIVMELCNENLDDFLDRRKYGFNPKEIKEIFSLLNNVFKISYKKIYQPIYKNILIKYLDKNKARYHFKFKFSDSIRAINPITDYSSFYSSSHFHNCTSFKNDCFTKGCVLQKDILPSLGSIIYKLFFKEYPYGHNNSNCNNISLRKTNDKDLDDLLNKLLKKEDFSWEEYFIHPFFENNK